MDALDAVPWAEALQAKRESARVVGGNLGLVSRARAATLAMGLCVVAYVVHVVQTSARRDSVKL